jgi:hypothetical protein
MLGRGVRFDVQKFSLDIDAVAFFTFAKFPIFFAALLLHLSRLNFKFDFE